MPAGFTSARNVAAAGWGPISGVRSFFASRLSLLISTWVYALVLNYAHREYLSVDWAYLGFTYSALDAADMVAMLALVGLPVVCLPKRFDRPSALILALLFVVVFVPAVVIGVGLYIRWPSEYGPTLAVFTISFLGICAVTQIGPPRANPAGQMPIPSNSLTLGLFAVWGIISGILVLAYYDIMSFANLDEIYEQRFAVNRSLSVLGYVRTYYSGLLTPALIAVGLATRQPLLVLAGFSGGLLTYLIDARKIALVLPFAMVLLFLSIKGRSRVFDTTTALIIMISFLTLITLAGQSTPAGDLLSRQFVFRTLGVPGLTLAQYQDYFGQFGYTWWTNLNIVNLLVDPPKAYASDPSWPRLGEMLGVHYYGIRGNLVNLNASPFTGEGVAAGGPVGVLVISGFLAMWLRILDRAAEGWDRTLVLLLVFPFAVLLTNVHLSTVLVSFGGAMLTVVFLAMNGGRASPGKIA